MREVSQLVFSQSRLQDYADCPRRFQLRYLLDLEWPALETDQALELEAAMRRGEEFHHLLHQHALGVPAALLETTFEDELIGPWWKRYLSWQEAHLPAVRQAEISLTTTLGELDDAGTAVRLTAKFDLVAKLADGTLLIIDWKTGRPPGPGGRGRLAARLQTIVYRYVLARAGDWLNGGTPVDPARLRMLYWFAEDGSTIAFDYDRAQYRRDEDRLRSLLGEIIGRVDYPLTSDERRCRFCSYRSFCERPFVELELDSALSEEWDGRMDSDGLNSLNLDDLDEISF